MKKLITLIPAVLFIFYSCSASTDTRYETDKDKSNDKKETDVDIAEDFDFTPYRTKLDIPGKELSMPVSSGKSEIWYGYEETESDTSVILNKKIIDKAQGYRVLLLTTDNLDEANDLRTEIYFNSIRQDVYVIFDPPFYKVMAGDFSEYSEAKDLSFKMNQLGYTEARVVNETINIFEK
jgi:hypothetical protein